MVSSQSVLHNCDMQDFYFEDMYPDVFDILNTLDVQCAFSFSDKAFHQYLAVCLCRLGKNLGGRLNRKMSSYQYNNSRYKDKTISRPSYFHNVNLHPERPSLYWKGVDESKSSEARENSPQYWYAKELCNFKVNFSTNDPIRSWGWLH